MASNVFKNPSVKNLIARNFAAQASVQQQSYPLAQPQQIQVSKLPNGVVVASIENNSPLSRIALYVKSGPRYETADTLGISHIARLCAGLRTKNLTAFGITRKTQQMGSSLLCESGREHMAYSMTVSRDSLYDAYEVLADVALQPSFVPWEVDMMMSHRLTEGEPTSPPEALQQRLQTELAARPASVIALDLLHAAAFRETPLGHSLFMPPYHATQFHSEQLQAFVRATHTSSRVVAVGSGVEHVDFVRLVRDRSEVPLGPGAASPPAAYGGGEVRRETGAPSACVAIAASGARLGGAEALALGVAQFALGAPSAVKRGANASSRLAGLVAGAGGSGLAAPLNLQYSDGGLFGVLLQEGAETVGEVVRAVSKGIRSLKLTEADVQVAKTKAKAAISMALESPDRELEEIGMQMLFTGKYSSRDEVVAAIDKLPSAAVQSALANAVKGKGSMVAIGGLKNVPYLDQL